MTGTHRSGRSPELDAGYWIATLDLAPHPERGYYRETYRSEVEVVLTERSRPASTAIYYLLEGTDISRLHRLASDEVWHFYDGSSLTLQIIDREGTYSRVRLGPNPDGGEELQAVICAGSWFGARVDDPLSYSLIGCTVAPGFDFADYEAADRATLIGQYPQHSEIIRALTDA